MLRLLLQTEAGTQPVHITHAQDRGEEEEQLPPAMCTARAVYIQPFHILLTLIVSGEEIFPFTDTELSLGWDATMFLF